MIGRLRVENFRSIHEANVDFSPITVFYGPTAAGKSSLLYSLLVLRNFVLNSNQTVDGLFSLGFQGLGGLEACIFNHDVSDELAIEAEFAGLDEVSSYGLKLRKSDCDINTRYGNIALNAKVAMPYPANQSWQIEYADQKDGQFSISWNGFAATAIPKDDSPEAPTKARVISEKLNYAAEALKRIDICPHVRGFTKPSHVQSSVSSTPTTEDEVATLIINDQYAAGRISAVTHKIFGREFRIYTPPGTATANLQTTEVEGARVPGLLVNDGFGVNQVVYMLAKILRTGVKTIMIEEPEVHLHPIIIRELARYMTRLVIEDEKQLILTTHSGQLLLSLLSCVKEGLIQPEQLACYSVDRDGRRSIFKREIVTKDGQIPGGLSSFMEPELEDLKNFFNKG